MKLKFNYAIDAGLLLGSLACSITGILKLPELNVALGPEAYESLSLLHDWSGVAVLALSLVHVVAHAVWIKNATTAVFRRGDRAEDRDRAAIIYRRRDRATTAKGVKSAAKIATSLTVICILGLVGASPLSARGRHFSNATIPQGIDYPAGTLKDGVYTGTADGYMPSLSVEVTVKGGKIDSVRIAENSETPRWLAMVSSVIPKRIVAVQGTQIDIVSGATASSHGIMSAVENALAKAAK